MAHNRDRKDRNSAKRNNARAVHQDQNAAEQFDRGEEVVVRLVFGDAELGSIGGTGTFLAANWPATPLTFTSLPDPDATKTIGIRIRPTA